MRRTTFGELKNGTEFFHGGRFWRKKPQRVGDGPQGFAPGADVMVVYPNGERRPLCILRRFNPAVPVWVEA